MRVRPEASLPWRMSKMLCSAMSRRVRASVEPSRERSMTFWEARIKLRM